MAGWNLSMHGKYTNENLECPLRRAANYNSNIVGTWLDPEVLA